MFRNDWFYTLNIFYCSKSKRIRHKLNNLDNLIPDWFYMNMLMW